MNQRFRVLAEQVEWRFADRLTGEFSEYDKRLLKFAELIVRECAEVVQEGRWMVPPSQEQLARSIKQHFGVEE